MALLLLACLAFGFLIHRLTHPRTQTLRVLAPGAALAQRAPPAPAPRVIPESVPDIALPGTDGAVRHLSDFGARPLVINFWATWCEPCRREIPLLRRLRHERAAEGLEIVGIAIDSAGEVRKYAAAQGIDYPLLIGEDGGLAAANAFGMDTVLPFSVFADRRGRIVTLKVGELRAEEARLILDRVRAEDSGRLSLAAARQQIAAAMEHEPAARVAAGQ